MILAKRSLDQVEAHALNSASSVSPQIPQATTADLQDTSTKYLQDRVYDLSFRVTAAFVLIPSSSSGDLPEFHSLCISYSMLILSQFEELPSSIPRNELLAALAEVKRRCNESNAYSIAVRFSVERAWERLRMDSHNLSTVEPTGLESQFNVPVGLAQSTNKSNQNTMSGSQVGGDSQALQQSGTVNTVGSGIESLENMDFFFNGGYLDILDIDNFLL
ncbi:hypothetical protein NW762_002028 [Fusarium torreyae]|uniref:Uncharacterized protein n=1 Tax=Fusarium torreyae TaxID=1237075 RepID=A0A9W8VPG3_9HYPO|nr:hypothetical protein NW762_002028 [Fusarium torreyae]